MMYKEELILAEINKKHFIGEKEPRIEVLKIRISPKGIDYLTNNSAMKKVEKAIKEWIPVFKI